MMGIEGPMVWLGYLLCIVSAIGCVVYGCFHWNRGDEPVEHDDVQWAEQEKKVEEEM